MQEVWKDIPGYEGSYQVSNLGNVKSLERYVERTNQAGYRTKSKILKQRVGKQGYSYVLLYKHGCGETASIHRLVAGCFIPNPEEKRCVNHIDGNKQNNCVNNLEWVSHSDNTIHAFENGLVDCGNISKGHMNPKFMNKNNTSGRKGVYFNKARQKWQAYIRIDGKMHYLGIYSDISDAIKARENKEKELF